MSMDEMVSIPIDLHVEQERFCQSEAKFRACHAGIGGGKSWVLALDLFSRALPRRTYMLVAPTYRGLKRSTLRSIQKLNEKVPVIRQFYKADMVIELANGAEIFLATADDPDGLRGPNLSGVALDEASLMAEETYDICMGRLREGGEMGWLSACFTPKGVSHWTYKRFGEPQPDTEVFTWETKDNPFNPPEFSDVLSQQYFGAWRAQELGGAFVSIEGAEFPAEFFDGILFDEWPADHSQYVKVMALDPSKGKSDGSGDDSAWIMLAVEPSSATLWVDADLDNTRPVVPMASVPGMKSIVTDGIAHYRRFGPRAVLVETNGFQEMVATELLSRSSREGLPMPIYTVNHTDPKPQRIRGLAPIMGQRRLRIKNTPGGRRLLSQLRDFRGDQKKSAGIRDDGPDALWTAVEMANHLIYGKSNGDDNKVYVLRG